jgi:hypothetical protein
VSPRTNLNSVKKGNNSCFLRISVEADQPMATLLSYPVPNYRGFRD